MYITAFNAVTQDVSKTFLLYLRTQLILNKLNSNRIYKSGLHCGIYRIFGERFMMSYCAILTP
nr:MAG TPA: hypothetical protein [Caudoviricetes sp.]